MPFQLTFNLDAGEEIFFGPVNPGGREGPQQPGRPVYQEQTLPLLGLSYHLLKRFKRFTGSQENPSPARVYSLLESLASGVPGVGIDWLETEEPFVPTVYYGADEEFPLLPEAENYHEADWYWLEILALSQAAGAWLAPVSRDKRRRLIPPSVRFAEKWDTREEDALAREVYAGIRSGLNKEIIPAYLHAVLKYRMGQLSFWVDVREGKSGRRILLKGCRSSSFLALCWAEILTAVENNIFAQFCRNCGGLFPLESPYKKIYCSDKCSIEYMRRTWPGGEEGFKEYMRQKKRESREREKEMKRRSRGRR